ncbi:MAG: hypothetical protein ABFD49_01100 [Armatimonadota bacterium]|nr:hypothetical protein [bacterium]
MKVLLTLIATAILLVIFAGGAYAVGKTLVDPNTCPASMATSAQTDKRLEQKITYFSGYVRLSDAIFEIGEMSKISISTGRNRSDWQVRDMPVVICANDIEVGKLLKLLADAYFLWQSVTNIGDVPVYRLYRSKYLLEQLNEYASAMDDYGAQLDATERRILCWLGTLDINNIERLYEQTLQTDPRFGSLYGSNGEGARLAFEEIVIYGKLVSTLSDSMLSRLSTGDTIVFSAQQDDDVGRLVRDYARVRTEISRLVRAKHSDGSSETDNDNYATEADISSASIRFQMDPDECYPNNAIMTIGSSGQTAFTGDLLGMILTLPRDTLPRVPGSPPSQNRDLKRISSSDDVDSEKKYDLQLSPKSEVQLADLLTAMSKATGYTVVADDYVNHKAARNIKADDKLFSGKASLLDMKRELDTFDWYIDSDSRRMILRDWAWCDRYCNLIPRAWFSCLLKNVSNSCLKLEDLLEIWQLTDGQMRDWISGVEKLNNLMLPSFGSDQKALLRWMSNMSGQARSDGLPVTNIPIDQFAVILKRLSPNTQLQEDVSQLILKLIKKDAPECRKHTYSVEISGRYTHFEFNLDLLFPIYASGVKSTFSGQHSKTQDN